MVPGFPLRAILLPHPTTNTVTTARPVPPEAAYKALLPDTLFIALGRPQLITRALNQVVRSLPCFELALGTDVAGVPPAIADVLASVRSAA